MKTAPFSDKTLPWRYLVMIPIFLLCMVIPGSPDAIAAQSINKHPSQLFVNLNLIKPYRVETSPVNYLNVSVDEPVRLPKTRFMKPVTLISARFREIVSVNLSVFMSAVVMNGVTFDDVVNAGWVVFYDDVNLYNVHFKDTVSFFNCIFNHPEKIFYFTAEKEAIFQNSTFNKPVKLAHSLFAGETSFYAVTFKGDALFYLDDFKRGVDFSNALFEKNLVFDSVNFHGLTNFSNAIFDGQVSFNRSTISGTLDLSNVNILGPDINLTLLTRESNQALVKLNVTGTDTDKINFFYNDFILYFPENIDDDAKITVYKTLLNNFQKRGYTASYQRLYAEYQQFEYLRHGEAVVNAIQKYWWNYGLNREMIFQWTAFFLAIFTAINSFFFVQLVTKYCSVPFLSRVTSDFTVNSNPVTRYIYYFPYAIILTIILFFGGFLRLGITSKEFISQNIVVNIYLMTVVSTGMACMFYIIKYMIS